MKAVIMAGGFGTRIHPLTINLPKPMIPLFNRPIMLHIIELLKRHGITELVLLLYHQPQIIKNFFRDGSDFGVRITYVTPLEDYGTAGAVKAAARHLDERFLIISGDLLTDFNLSDLIARHEQCQALASITLTRVADPLQFGVVITDPEERITKFLEKPGWGEVFSDTINTGIYVLEPEVLDLIPPEENRDWSKDIFPLMLERQLPLFGLLTEGYWQDIGNPEAYIEACRDIFAGRVRLELDEKCEEHAGAQLCTGRDVSLDPQARLEGMVVLGDNSQILGRTHLRNVVMGRNCTVEDGVELENVVLWDNVYVKRGSRAQSCVFGHNVRTGQGVTVDEQVVIADETLLGDDAHIKRGVLIWPRKEIESGAIVTGNLIWGEKWRRNLFDGSAVCGLTNVELTPEFAAKLGAAYGSTLPKGSFVLAGRDAIRASRMLKRSFVGGLLSAGVNVHDCKMVPLPVLRYKLTTFGEVGGIHFRQSPEDPAATEILFMDGEGLDAPTPMVKGIERLFFKENFRRAHYAEPGLLEDIPRIYDYYREGFRQRVDTGLLRQRQPKVVLDLNHSPAADLLPALLTDLGCEVLELNGHIDERPTGATPEITARALDQLARIVVTLEADAGFWLGPSGERLVMVSEQGEVLDARQALDVLVTLTSAVHSSGGRIVVPVSAPGTLEMITAGRGLHVQRTKTDHHTLLAAGLEQPCPLVATTEGRFAFPFFHAHFDALFTIARLLEMLTRVGQPLSRIVADLPQRGHVALRLACPWEVKGGIMRRASEECAGLETSYIDGVRIHSGDAWVLVLPDQVRPLVHVIADAPRPEQAQALAEEWQERVVRWKQDLGGEPA